MKTKDFQIVFNGVQYLDLVTDIELMTLYNKDQTWVDNVRAQAVSILSNKSGLESYQPIGTE